MMVLNNHAALGTRWHIEVFDQNIDQKLVASETIAFLERFEARYSRFRKTSWLSQLNQTGMYSQPDPEFVDILQESLEYFVSTGGVFNIAVGENMNHSGYDAAYSFVASKQQEDNLPDLADVLKVTKDQIRLRSGALDLGGIGKGYVIDKLANWLQSKFLLQSFIINGGGDIYATHHADGTSIEVTLTHPKNPKLGIGTVVLHNQGFASSSPWLRSWVDKHSGTVINHLLTARQVTSYVVAPTVTEADVWATTLCISDDVQPPSSYEILLLDDTKIIARTDSFKLHSQGS